MTETLIARHSGSSKWEVIRCWELRRIPYNVALLVIGVSSIILMELIGEKVVAPGEDFVEPIVMFFGIPLYAIAANACYTLGWILELNRVQGGIEEHRRFRVTNFRRGLAFSCLLTTAPVWIAALSWTVNRL